MGNSSRYALIIRRASTLALTLLGLAGGSIGAFAAPGEVIRTVVLPAEVNCGGTGTSIAVVPGAAVGLPGEPILLVTSCFSFDPAETAKLYFVRPSPGPVPAALVLTLTTTITAPFGWGALAFRSDKGDLLACGNFNSAEGIGTHEIYSIPLSKSFASDKLPAATPVKLFNGRPGHGFTICDGIGWDTVENHVYQSPDVFDTVYRFNEAGQLVGPGEPTGTIPVPAGCSQGGQIRSNSGVAVSGQNLYLGCADDPEIYRVDKNTGAVLQIFASPQIRTEDLECDPTTFGAEQKDVLWTKGAHENNLIAIEVPRGACGGPIPVAVGPNQLCTDLTDTDGDGLLDCWERPSPLSAGANGQPCIDFDGDGVCDLTLCVNSGDGKGTVCADPYRKDVFVEVDWLEGHRPNQAAITRVINKFDVAAVANPVNPATGTSVSGVRLHVLMDEPLKDANGVVIPHNTGNAFANGLLAFEPYTAVAPPGVLDFDALKKNNFGTLAQRANPKALDAKRQAFRYMIFGHLLAGLGGSSGAAEVHGNDGVVTLGAGLVVGGHAVGSEDQQAGTFFHELGHLLGLRHGGGDFVGCKPNYLSVMNYTRQLPGSPIPTTQWKATALDFSRSERPPLDKNNLNEQAGIGGASGDVTVFGPNSGVVRGATGPIDWNRDNVTSITAFPLPLLNQIVNSAGTVCAGDGPTLLQGYNDWANLKYDVRSSLDIADGERLSLVDREPELGFAAPPDNPCAVPGSCPVALTTTDEGLVDSDGDGVPDFMDNCPATPNPAQENVCAETAVSIDIRPARYPNTVNVDSIFPLAVAILGAPGFDATQVRPETVRLSGAPVIRVGPAYLCARVDVNKDGLTDFVCIVDKRALILPADDAVAVLTATTRANVSIRGEDSIHILHGKRYHDDD